MFPLTMTGFDRTYLPPRSIREQVGGPVTAWDLFRLEHQEISEQWATATLDSLVAAIDGEGSDLLGCTECRDTGFYGIPDDTDPDLLVGLARRVGEDTFERLAASGEWEPPTEPVTTLEVLDLDLAGDLAAAITGGACGLLRRYSWPRAFLPPAPVVAAASLQDVLMSLVSPEPPENTDGEWVNYATVDPVDQGAVFDVVRVRVAGGVEQLERWDDRAWIPDAHLITQADLPMVRLTADQLADTQAQMNPSTLTAALPEHQKCKYCANEATKRIIHSEAMAYIPVCNDHLDKGTYDAAHCTPDGTADPSNIVRVDKITAGALLADAPLIVSPNPKAERLRRYWSTGKGGAKIRWTAPGSGDWYRCVRHLSKYMGLRAKGYCSNLHKRNTGVWPGDKKNRGLIHASAAAPEVRLLASVRTGQWGRNQERETDMPLAEATLADGIYFEGEDPDAGILQTITAGGFPVAPPESWFADPKLTGKTPMVIEDDGRVYGHIATWDVTHIGMAGEVPPPHSPSNYAYFRTGAVKTEEGNLVAVGHLTLSGGHADTRLDHAAAVKHYDDTNSAVADVATGEDQYGIWAAGAVRPDVTPAQIRAFRASPPSGDWRVIGGNLELVAACCVNVPGFVNVRAEARVASGAILALVAAGARPLVEIKAAMIADAAVLSRLSTLESRVEELAVPAPAEVVELEPVSADATPAAEAEPAAKVVDETEPELPEMTEAEIARAERISKARGEVIDIRRKLLRNKVHPEATTAAMPPQFLAHKKGPGDTKAASTIKGTDSFPISDVASLKKAIQAFGRAGDKPAAKKHIISMAYKLKRPDLIPANWK